MIHVELTESAVKKKRFSGEQISRKAD